MEIINLLESNKKEYYANKIKESHWGAGEFLYYLISDGSIYKTLGENTKVMLLLDNDEIVSYCTFADLDDIQPIDLTPWIGFVYTYEKYRGHRYAEKLINHCIGLAKEKNFEYVYISSDHTGLYEKFGFSVLKKAITINGDEAKIFVKKI